MVFLVVYVVGSEKGSIKNYKIISLSINNNYVDLRTSLRVFTCSNNNETSWTLTGLEALNKSIDLIPNTNIRLEIQTSTINKNFANFSLPYSIKNEQSIICLSVLNSEGQICDVLYLYYFLIDEYAFPIGDYDIPLFLKLPTVKCNTKRSPVLVGHAGAGVHREFNGIGIKWSENTICAFRRSEQLGIQMVECDAGLTKDDQVVLHHNFTLIMECEITDANGEPKYVLQNKPDPPVTENTSDLTINYSFDEIRNMLKKLESLTIKPTMSSCIKSDVSFKRYPNPLTIDDPIPDLNGRQGALVPLLKDAFFQTSTKLAFNVEMKYPTQTFYNIVGKRIADKNPVDIDLKSPSHYFALINKFCDTLLDTIWTSAGSRHIALSSFNPDICLALRLKQSHFPVLFISRGSLTTDPTSRMDPRHYSLMSAINWAHLMDLAGIVTVGEYFGSTKKKDMEHPPRQYSEVLEAKNLACFVYGEGVSDVQFLDQATNVGLSGVIIDRVEQYMQEYKSSTYAQLPQIINSE